MNPNMLNVVFLTALVLIAVIIIGVVFGYCSFKLSYIKQEKRLKKAEEKELVKLLKSIADEVENFVEYYQGAIGSTLESLNEKEGLTHYFTLDSNFFNVYNSNFSQIGNIRNSELRKKIVKTYTLMKSMDNSFRINNDLVYRLDFSQHMYEENQQDVYKDQTVAGFTNVVTFTKSLKERHKELTIETASLLESLNAERESGR